MGAKRVRAEGEGQGGWGGVEKRQKHGRAQEAQCEGVEQASGVCKRARRDILRQDKSSSMSIRCRYSCVQPYTQT